MPTTPVSKGRPPLIPVSDNVRNAPSLSPAPGHKAKAVGFRSTPEKRTRETVDSRSPGKEAALNSRSNYETPFADDRGGKKSRVLPPGKRVSFGGNSIRIIPQTNTDSSSKPLTEDRETSSTYMEIERIRTPPLSKRNPDMVSGINDDSDMDTFSATRLPSRISESPSRLVFTSGLQKSPKSPNARRPSTFRASGRQSFGLFVDEDITMACRDIRIDPNDDDVTQTLPSGPSMCKEKIQEPEDGDITYTLGYGLRDLITEASHDEELTGNKNKNISCSSPAEDGIPEQLGVRNEFHPDEKLDTGTPESGRQGTPRESQNNEYGILMDHNKASEQHPVPSTRQEDHSPRLSNLLDESTVDNHLPGKQSTVQTGVNEKETGHSQNLPLLAPNEDDQERVQRNDFDGNGNGDLQTQVAENMNTLEEPMRDSGMIATPGANNNRNLDAFHRTDSPHLPEPIGETLEGPAHDAIAEYQGLPSSMMDSSDPKPTERVSPAHRATDFNLDQHLRAVDVRFDNPARSVGREASLAPMESLPPKFDPSSSELASYELMKERYFLERLRKEKNRLKAEISSVMKSVEAIENEIEAQRPPMVEMLAKYDDHSTTAIAPFRCAVKRLRKTSAFEARGKWVTSRRGWETEICNGMDQCCTELEKDAEQTKAKRAAILDLADRFNEVFELSDTRKNDEEEGMETLSVAPMLFNREMSTVTDLREYVVTQELYRKDAQRKRALLEPLESRLSRECGELECYMGKGSPALRKLIMEKHEQSSIIAGVTGISLSRISTNSIALTICGLVNLYFTLHEERVINTSCKPLRFLDKESASILKTFIEGAVTLSSFAAQLRTVKMAHDIPMALRRFSHWMMRTQCLLEEAHRYYELHMGSITNSSVTDVNGSPSLHVDVSGSFYSLPLRSQFNVVVSITIHTVPDCAEIQEHVVLKAVTRTIGNSPDDDAIQEAVLNANRGRPFSLYDAFEAIWNLLR